MLACGCSRDARAWMLTRRSRVDAHAMLARGCSRDARATLARRSRDARAWMLNRMGEAPRHWTRNGRNQRNTRNKGLKCAGDGAVLGAIHGTGDLKNKQSVRFRRFRVIRAQGRLVFATEMKSEQADGCSPEGLTQNGRSDAERRSGARQESYTRNGPTLPPRPSLEMRASTPIANQHASMNEPP
jgi:hypothetical protein